PPAQAPGRRPGGVAGARAGFRGRGPGRDQAARGVGRPRKAPGTAQAGRSAGDARQRPSGEYCHPPRRPGRTRGPTGWRLGASPRCAHPPAAVWYIESFLVETAGRTARRVVLVRGDGSETNTDGPDYKPTRRPALVVQGPGRPGGRRGSRPTLGA